MHLYTVLSSRDNNFRDWSPPYDIFRILLQSTPSEVLLPQIQRHHPAPAEYVHVYRPYSLHSSFLQYDTDINLHRRLLRCLIIARKKVHGNDFHINHHTMKPFFPKSIRNFINSASLLLFKLCQHVHIDFQHLFLRF